MKRISKVLTLTPIVLTTIASLPLVMTSCNKKQDEEETGGDTGGGGSSTPVTTYSVSYSASPTGLALGTHPTSVTAKKSFSISFTLTNVTLDWDNCSITRGGTEIKSYCTHSNSIITVPAEQVTGNISVTLATYREATTYTITYKDTEGVSWKDETVNPKSVSTNEEFFQAYYTLSDGKIVDVENCEIWSGTTNVTDKAVISNNYLWLETIYLTGNVTIELALKDDDFEDEGITIPTESEDYIKVYTATQAAAAGINVVAASHYIVLNADAATTNDTINLTLTGNLTNTHILINGDNAAAYNITLNNCEISNTNSIQALSEAPILNSNKKATINFTISGTNTIRDLRTIQDEGYFENDAVIKSKGALTFSGDGTLNINDSSEQEVSCFGKGIQTTKGATLTITDSVTINAFALESAIQAAGAIIINGDSTVVADSYLDDGIKTKFDDPDDDISYKGSTGANKTRDITISGNANVTVYAARNAINCAHNFVTAADGDDEPTIKLYTSDRAQAQPDAVVSDVVPDEQNMYVAVPADDTYNKYSDIDNYYYTATFHDSTGTITKDTVEYMTLKKIKAQDGGQPPRNDANGTTYWFFQCDRPLEAFDQITITKYAKAQFGADSPVYTAATDALPISNGTGFSTNDTIVVSSISDRVISTGATSTSAFSQNYKSMIGQTSSIERVAGSKGIKARNEINIAAGDITVDTVDTGIVANYGNYFTNSKTAGDITAGTGNINITGGETTVTSKSGDGVKANGIYTITNGTVSVTKSVEALEAGITKIQGGVTKLIASDDGLNASQLGKYQTTYDTNNIDIQISGGVLDVQIDTSGDTDAIDSNKGLTMTGGLLVVRNKKSAIDTEQAISVTGGTLVCLGSVERGIDGIITTKYEDSVSLSGEGESHTIKYEGSKTYTFTNVMDMSTTTKYIYYSGTKPEFDPE